VEFVYVSGPDGFKHNAAVVIQVLTDWHFTGLLEESAGYTARVHQQPVVCHQTDCACCFCQSYWRRYVAARDFKNFLRAHRTMARLLRAKLRRQRALVLEERRQIAAAAKEAISGAGSQSPRARLQPSSADSCTFVGSQKVLSPAERARCRQAGGAAGVHSRRSPSSYLRCCKGVKE
jgi:hypothetical protein